MVTIVGIKEDFLFLKNFSPKHYQNISSAVRMRSHYQKAVGFLDPGSLGNMIGNSEGRYNTGENANGN